MPRSPRTLPRRWSHPLALLCLALTVGVATLPAPAAPPGRAQALRALDAPRATNGTVNFLGWSHEQQGQMRELELFAPSAQASHPDAWFQREEAVA